MEKKRKWEINGDGPRSNRVIVVSLDDDERQRHHLHPLHPNPHRTIHRPLHHRMRWIDIGSSDPMGSTKQIKWKKKKEKEEEERKREQRKEKERKRRKERRREEEEEVGLDMEMQREMGGIGGRK